MRVHTYPPFIVFFDTLAVLLFYLLVRQSSPINIEIPGSELPAGFEAVTSSNESADESLVDLELKLPCQDVQQCAVLFGDKSEEFMLRLPQKLVDEIARLKLISSESGCGKLNIVIGADGRIDRLKTIEKSDCLSSIPKILEWARKK
jgi:hypothetical protein